MSSLCENCGKNELDINEQVCHGCGVVQDEIFLDSGFNPFSSDTKPRLHLYPKKKNSEGLKHGLRILENLSHQYNLPAHVKTEALDLLRDVYSTKSFSTKHDIGVMAGCCLVHIQKKSCNFVSLVELCKRLECSKKKAFKFTNILKKHCNAHGEGHSANNDISVDETGEGLCNNNDITEKLESSIVSVFASLSIDNKEKLMEKTRSLTALANSCWLISGRSPEGIIVAAIYLCWKSIYPRHNLPFKKFCSEYSLPYGKSTSRLSELKEMLVKLGQNIPSFSQNYINEKNIFYHLDYILKNSETLRNDMLPNEFTATEIDKKEYSVFRKIKQKIKKNSESEGDLNVKYAPDMCASDIEISDSEIESYLRTPEQIEVIKMLRGKSGS